LGARRLPGVRHSSGPPRGGGGGAVEKGKGARGATGAPRPAWGRAKSLHWKSDAFRIQGWLLYPEPFDPRQRYPMVVNVHGGPASAVTPSWPGEFSIPAALSRRGCFVFLPHPRRSLGSGGEVTPGELKDLR